MLFTVDGLLVHCGEAGETPAKSEQKLSVMEGRQLVTLFRLIHRLHYTRSGNFAECCSEPQFDPPYCPKGQGGEAMTQNCCDGVCANNIGEDNHSWQSMGSGEGTYGCHRSASEVERADPFEGGRGAYQTSLQILTSQRELSCVQHQLPCTRDAVLWCTASSRC
ncbi:hypothetical protein TRVL_00857 [Trypanosoma vivax]|nr:hypothetical protein TRVL_00857 [Trypanosoma vivax]